ncbi:MAG: enoyl-CoA hydratase/isomerase family protein [Gammaproteobacteria bacterium]|nr:enoyl-CoA hydratase/isomerase family protein [Gammaproteobacteria bacterium]
MASELQLKHWSIETDTNQIAWCRLDVQGESANVLSREVMAEFGQVLDSLEQHPPRGVAILSGKDNGFIAGANVKEFSRVQDRAEAERVIREAHALFNRLEKLPCPTVSAIKGFCLGGGLEMALACRLRVACSESGTRLGFPEVMLGIFPGFGGSMRAVRRIGPLHALELMLSGRTVDARAASRMGLVDRAVPERQLIPAARALLLQPPGPAQRRILDRLLALRPLRVLLATFLRRQLRSRARREHYPAPYVIVEHWEENGGSDPAMLESEARRVPELLMTPASRNLVRAYLLQERLRSLGRESEPRVERAHVVGAGVMGGDIAAWCVAQGLTVTLQDREPRFIAVALKRARALFAKRLKDRRLVQNAMDRLLPDLDGRGVPAADLVIEAIVEKEQAKIDLFRAVEPRLKNTAMLATNTSSIALETLNRGLAQPGRLVGIHFFNPVDRMQLVEIVHGEGTAQEWTQRAAAFCRQIGRLPLPVRSAPGFLVNRVLTPYLLEATTLLEEGVAAEAIDEAAMAFGMPMGPVELADTVGLDICLSVAQHLSAKLRAPVPKRLEKLVQEGRLGRKSGRGYYEFHNGKARKSKVEAAPQVLQGIEERLVMRLLNECIACLREGIVEDADLLDAGMIYGTGFAPFRGGPMQYARSLGRARIVERLNALQARCGDRFAADAGWAVFAN